MELVLDDQQCKTVKSRTWAKSWWPDEWLTDDAYYGYRIGIDNNGTWRFAVAGD